MSAPVLISMFKDGKWNRVPPHGVGAVCGSLAVTQATATDVWTVTHVPSGWCFTGAFDRAGVTAPSRKQAEAALQAIADLADWHAVDSNGKVANVWLRKRPALRGQMVEAIRKAVFS